MTDVDIPPIADAHHHLWDMRDYHVWLHANPRVVNFVGDYESICQDYLASDYLADTEGLPVIASVHVQAEFDPSNPVGETEWLSRQAEATGFPMGIVGFADLSHPDVQALLEAHAEYDRFRGIRHMLNWDTVPGRSFAEHGDYMGSDAWRRGFALLAQMGLRFDMQIWPNQMQEAASLVAAYPDARVALNHTGFPIDRDPESMDMWRAGMCALAANSNVSVKISGLGMLDHHWTADSIRPIVLETIDIFGPDRAMFASNFPVDKLYTDYATIFRAFSEITADFTPAERERLFAGTAIEFYDLTPVA
jgi:predicted TIM-barrel fold metal-dependent hydrolase